MKTIIPNFSLKKSYLFFIAFLGFSLFSFGQIVSFNRIISTGSDDAEEDITDNSVNINSTDLELTFDPGGTGNEQIVGVRFTNVTIPQGVAVSNAYIQFQADQTSSVAGTISIYGEDVGNANTFTTGASNISNRVSTTATVSWSPLAWTNNSRGVNERTVDISTIIQEIVGRADWVSGNSLVIMFSGGGASNIRRADTYNNVPAEAAEIFIDYAGADPIVTITSPATDPFTVDIGVAVSFGWSATDANDLIASGTWDPGDGTGTSAPIAGAGPFSASHMYSVAGVYTATLSATDNNASPNTGSSTIQINVVDPNTTVVIVSTDGTWTVPTGVSSIQVEGWGGGAGADSPGTGSGASDEGGGGAAYATVTFIVTPGEVFNVTIGQGGATNNNGGNTIFNSASTTSQLAVVGGNSWGASGPASGGLFVNCSQSNGTSFSGTDGGNGSDNLNNDGGGGGASGSPAGNGGAGSPGTGGVIAGGIVGTDGGNGGDGAGLNANGIPGGVPGGGAGGRGNGGDNTGIAGGNGQLRITYSSNAPVVTITQPSINPVSVTIGTTVTLTGNATHPDNIASGTWDPGDGTTPTVITGAGPFSITHTYSVAGTYNAVLSATSAGAVPSTGSSTTQIIVLDPNVPQVYTTTGIFVVPSTVNTISVEAWGAGAGGGSGGGAEQGGGAGAYVNHTFNVTPGQTYTVVIPQASGPQQSGGDAVVSLAGATIILAKGAPAVASGNPGGLGGSAAQSSPSTSAKSGGTGGDEPTGTEDFGGAGGGSAYASGIGTDGEDGNTAVISGVRALGGVGHDGTASGLGAGGAGGWNSGGNNSGLNGLAPGGGGGGKSTGTATSGSGARGEVIITFTEATPVDLSITKAVSNNTPETLDNITFTLTAANIGANSAPNVEVDDLLRDGYTYVSSTTATGSYNFATGIWTVGTLAASTSATLTIVAKVNCSGSYFNVASISTDATAFDTDPDNNRTIIGVTPTYGPSNCIEAVDDLSSAISSAGGVAIVDILANDLLNGSQIAPAAVTLTETSPFVNAGVTYNATTRQVDVAPNTPAGDHTMTYQICDVTDPTNCESATVRVFITELVDDYINQPVSNCQSPPDVTSIFGIQLDKETPVGNLVDLYSSPLMADIDNDGVVEIIALSSNNIQTTSPRGAKDILIFNGQTGALESTITTPQISHDGGTAFAVADIDGDGFGELIIASSYAATGGDDEYLFCYEHDGTLKWKSSTQYGVNAGANGSASTVGIADFNQDGTPEVYVYNEIFNALTGAKLVDGGTNGIADPSWTYQSVFQAIPAAGDVLPSAGLELVCGRTVYEVTEAGGTWTMNPINIAVSEFAASATLSIDELDGFTGLADFDLDGELDVVVAADDGTNTFIYVWNPRNASGSRLMSEFDLGVSGRNGALFIGDVDGTGTPNIGLCQVNEVEMLSFSAGALSRKWTLATTDGSGRTALTMFDFNQDGLEEMVYRDETLLRIFDGSGATPNVLAFFPVNSTTGMEGPIVGDIDSDGSAEIVVANQNGTQTAQLQFYRSSLDPWAPGRSVWNQYAYFITHINDDLSIPQFQSNHGQQFFFNNSDCPQTFSERPLNKFSVQSTYFTLNGCPSFPTFDAAIEINSATLPCPSTDLALTYTVYNYADETAIPVGTSISFYAGNPLVSGATLLTTTTLATAVLPGANSGVISITITGITSNTKIFAVANDDGSQTSPLEMPTTSQFECDYSNNFAFFTARCENTNPDINASFVNVPVPGDVSTNDDVPATVTYGSTPALSSAPAGSNPTITMAADGTYTFTGDVVGTYSYTVEVCIPPAASPGCASELLYIIVTDPIITTNVPSANTDFAATIEATPVTLATLANDNASSPGATLDPASVVISGTPPDAVTEGSLSVNATTGDITFTPVAGFTGTVIYTYQVCEASPNGANCDIAIQEVTVEPTGTDMIAASDDYNKTIQNKPVSASAANGVLANDVTTTVGGTLSVALASQGNRVVAGKGIFNIASDGSYTFTPFVGFTGPVSIDYLVNDGTASANATLYILVDPFETTPDINATFTNTAVTGNVNTNDYLLAGSTYGTPVAVAGNPNAVVPTMNADGAYTFTPTLKGVYKFNVPVCLEGQTPESTCATELLTITVEDAGVTTNLPPIANTDVASTKEDVNVVLKTLSNDAIGTFGSTLDPSSVAIVTGPNPATEGTATVNVATGDITFDPVPGFTGIVTYTYTVCDDQATPLCSQATQEVVVLPTTAQNSVSATDDYVETEKGVAVVGNVLTNDIDPDGNSLTVTANTVTNGAGTVVFAADGSYTFTPLANYVGPGEFIYEVCDDATPSACTNATLHVLVNEETFAASGTTWYDINGLTDAIFNGTAQGSADLTNAGTEPLFINYIDDNGIVVASTQVASNGTWNLQTTTFPNAIFQMSTTQGVEGQAQPATTLPTGWGNTGEGTTGTGDGSPDGEFTTTLAADLTGLNFGFQQLPVTIAAANDVTKPNPGGTALETVDVTLFAGTDDGTVEKIRITSFPTNTTSFAVGTNMYYPNSGAIPGTCPTGFNCVDFSTIVAGYVEFPATGNAAGDPVPVVKIDPVDNSPTSIISVITYATVDNAGAQDDGTGDVNVPFSGDRSMTVLATVSCDADRPYLTLAIAANFDITGMDATLDWTAGAFDGTLINPSSNPLVTTFQNANVIILNILNPAPGQWTGDLKVLWPGAAESGGAGTNWPGWVNDAIVGWRAEEDGYSGYRDAGTSIDVTVNPTVTVSSLAYPPSSPFCASEPRAVLTGTVWQDADGSGDAAWQTIPTNSENGTNASSGITAYVIGTDPSTGVLTVLDVSTVAADGTYSFSDLIQANDHQIILSTDATKVQGDVASGNGLPIASLPTGWAETSPITRTPVNTTAGDLNNTDLGIHLLPTSGAPDLAGTVISNVIQGTRYNPGVIGAFAIPIEGFGGNDPDPSGAINGLVITALDANLLSITDGTTTVYRLATDIPTTCPTTTCVGLDVVGTFEFAAQTDGQPSTPLSITPINGFLDGTVTVDYKTADIAGGISTTGTTLSIPFIALKYEVSTGGWSNGSDGSGKPDLTDGTKTLFWIDAPATNADIMDVNAVVQNIIIYPGIEAVVTSCLTVNDGVQNEGTVRFKAVDDGSVGGSGTPDYGQYKGPELPNAIFEMYISEVGWHNIAFPVKQANGNPLTVQQFADANNDPLGDNQVVNITGDPTTQNLWYYESSISSGKEQGFFMNRSNNTVTEGLNGNGYSSHAYGTWVMYGAGNTLNSAGANYYVDASNVSSFPLTLKAVGMTNAEVFNIATHDNWGGWNLVPNPYPVTLSVLNMNGATGAPNFFGTNFDQAVWIWNPGDGFLSPIPGRFSKGAYVAVDATTGVAVTYPANASGNVNGSETKIAPFQSFYVRRVTASKDRRLTVGGGDPIVESFAVNPAVAAGTTTDANRVVVSGANQGSLNVTIDPAHRSGCEIVQHYKTDWDIMLLYAVDQSDKELGDATELVFDMRFTDNYDLGLDISKLGGGDAAPILFTVVEGEAMVINKMAYPKKVTTVPLGFYSVHNNREFSIELPRVPTGWTVYLEDTYNGKWHNLSNSSYVFENNTEFKIARFVLHFSMKTSDDNIVPKTPKAIAWRTEEGIDVSFSGFTNPEATVVVSNLNGQIIYTNDRVSTSQNLNIPINDRGTNVYLVNIITTEYTTTEKVMR